MQSNKYNDVEIAVSDCGFATRSHRASIISCEQSDGYDGEVR